MVDICFNMMFVCVCERESTRVCSCVCVHMYAGVHACGGQKMSGVLLHCSMLYTLDTIPLNPKLSVFGQVGWSASPHDPLVSIFSCRCYRAYRVVPNVYMAVGIQTLIFQLVQQVSHLPFIFSDTLFYRVWMYVSLLAFLNIFRNISQETSMSGVAIGVFFL